MYCSSTLTEKLVVRERLAVVPCPCREVGIGVRFNISEFVLGRSIRYERTKGTHVLMYSAVGKSVGSHPILRAFEGWYTRM